ncbi:sensor histidine kinase [Eubacterium sp.]
MDRIIDLTDFSFFFLLFSFSKSFSDFVIIHSFMKDKYNKFVTLFTTVFLYTLYDITNQNLKPIEDESNGFNYTFLVAVGLLFLVHFTTITVCTEGTLKNKFFHSVEITFLSLVKWILTGMTGSYFFINELNGTADSLPSYEMSLGLLLCASLIYFVYGYLFALLFKLFSKNMRSTFSLKYAYFYFFPIANIIPAVLLLGITPSNAKIEYEKGYSIICTFIYIIAFSIDLLSIFIIDRIIYTDERNKQLTVIATKNELEYQSALIVKEEQEHLKRFRHDIRNINKTVKSLLEAGKTDEAMKLLDESSVEAEKTSGVTLCRCNIINTVLYMKSNEAKEHGIAILCNVTESSACKLSDIDISRVLLNLCDNAINAAKECEKKQIKIDIEINDKLIKINTENHYIPSKTKRPSPEHGNGTKIIKQISKKYGGEYKAEATDGIYKTQTYLRNINIE